MLPPLPRCGGGAWPSLRRPTVSAFPGTTAGSARTLSFSRFARRSLALRPVHSRRSPKCDPLPEGFSHFVTSMTAPVASGWSDWPGGAFTHWKAPPFTAHVECRLWPDFGAQPLYIQQRNLSTEALATRMCDPGGRALTVSFVPTRLRWPTYCSPFPTNTNGPHTLGCAKRPPLAMSGARDRRSASARPILGSAPLEAIIVILELDYPNVSAGGKGFENIREFRLKVMAGLDPAIQRLN